MNYLVINRLLYIICIAVICAVIFIIDINLQLGFAGGVPYVFPVLLSFYLNNPGQIILIAIVASGLTIIGFFLSPDSEVFWLVILNRFLALLVIWFTTWFVIKQIKRNDEFNLSQEIFSTAFRNSPHGVIICRLRDDKIIDVSDNIETITGLDRHRIIGRSALEIGIWRATGNRNEIIKTLLEHGKVHNIPIDLTDRDGNLHYYELSAELLQIRGDNCMLTVLNDVTDRISAENQLHKHEATIRAIFETSKDWIWAIDEKGNHTYSNFAVESILGYKPDELMGKTCLEFLYDDDKEFVINNLAKLTMDAKGWSNLVLRWRHKNGSYRYLESSGVPIFNLTGELAGFQGVDRDITEIRLNAEKLVRSEKMLADAQKLAHLGSWELDLVKNELIWSAEVYRIFEIDPDKFGASYTAFLNYIHPDDRKYVDNAYKESVVNNTEYNIEHRLLMKDGRIKYVNERGKTIYDDNGTAIRSIGTVQDITERVHMELALQKQRDFATNLVNTAPVIILLLDTEGKITHANPFFEQISGYKVDEIKGKDWFTTFLLESARNSIYELFKRAIKGHHTEGNINIIITRNGIARHIEWYDRPMYNVDGSISGLLCIGLDVTNRLRAEAQILESREKLKNLSERLRDIKEHERMKISREIHDQLGMMLTAISFEINLLGESILIKSSDSRKHISTIRTLVDETMVKVQKISQELRPAVLDDMGLAAAIDWQLRDFNKRTGCSYTLDMKIDDIGIDNKRDTALFRILQEALTNITRHAKATHVKVSLIQLDSHLKLVIEDNGAGINTESLSDKNNLGIIGMQERCEAFGGVFEIESPEDGGTRITCTIPM